MPDSNFEFSSKSHDDLDLLMQWKSEQYIRSGRVDIFHNEKVRSFLHDLLNQSDENFGLVLSKFSIETKPIAIEVSLRSTHTLAGWFPAYDIEYSKHSPGSVCFLKILKTASSLGIDRVDLGVGDAPYKESFKDAEFKLVSGWTDTGNPTALLRRASMFPKRTAVGFVLSNQRLRKLARNSLSMAGRVRSLIAKRDY